MATKRSRLCYMQGRGLCCSFPNRFTRALNRAQFENLGELVKNTIFVA